MNKIFIIVIMMLVAGLLSSEVAYSDSLLKAAQGGNAQAQYELGRCYSSGIGVKKDIKKSNKWYQLAADKGNTEAQVQLGVYYTWDEKRDKAEIVKGVNYLKSAVEKGNSDAQCYLAILYNYGQVIEQNYQEAIKLLRLSSEQGNAQAYYILGYNYYKGWGIIQNYEEAYYNWLLASAMGYKTDYKDRDFVANKLSPEQRSLSQERAQKTLDEHNK